MKLVINHEVWENKSLAEIIKILDEYIPKDDYQSFTLDAGIGQPIQKTVKKADWKATKDRLLLHIVREKLGSENISRNECRDCFTCIFHV